MKKKIWFKIICFIMLAILPALTLFAGCADKDANIDGNDGLNGEQLTSANLYGTKVLYRPDDYDYDIGSGGSSGDGSGTNDYYGKYAWFIINYLYNIYEIANTNETEKSNIQNNNPEFILDNIPYLYDSMRYQVNTEAAVTQRVVNHADGTETIEDLTVNNLTYYVVGADISLAWNWGAPYDLKLVYPDDYIMIDTNAFLTYSNYSSKKVSYDYYITNDKIYNAYDSLNDTEILSSFSRNEILNPKAKSEEELEIEMLQKMLEEKQAKLKAKKNRDFEM